MSKRRKSKHKAVHAGTDDGNCQPSAQPITYVTMTKCFWRGHGGMSSPMRRQEDKLAFSLIVGVLISRPSFHFTHFSVPLTRSLQDDIRHRGRRFKGH